MKALVLSSGGIDSTTAISIAIARYGIGNVETVSVIYGQKHLKEIEAAKRIAKYIGVAHHLIDLTNTGIYDKSPCSLLESSNNDIPEESYAEQIKKSGQVSTYVPFRNGLMLSAIAALGMSIFPGKRVALFLGNHADDSAGNAYPDCSYEFTLAMSSAIEVGTYGQVKLESPFVYMNKAQVIAEGLVLDTPYHLTWSCYHGGDKPCGKCGTCIDRAEAFKSNGVDDPAS